MEMKQADHLAQIIGFIHEELPRKYMRGAEEHNSNLSEDYTKEQLLDMAIEEAMDQLTYLITLKHKEE